MSEIWLLALGGNLPSIAGEPKETLLAAVSRLEQHGFRVLRVSRFFVTPCFPAGAGPDYVNAAIVVESSLSPDQLLAELHEVESKFGRVRETRWAGRTLDIDLIAGGNQVLPDVESFREWQHLPLEEQMRKSPVELILPHPRMHERAFVLVPLNDVAPDWVHPVLGRSVAEMLETLPDSDRKAAVSL